MEVEVVVVVSELVGSFQLVCLRLPLRVQLSGKLMAASTDCKVIY